MIRFPQHVQVKDKYCCFYLGDSPEYVVTLRLLKPQIEQSYPCMKFYIGCRERFKYLLFGECQTIFAEDIASIKDQFAHVRELRNDHSKHAVQEFIEESLTIKPIQEKVEIKRGVCLICPEGIPPVKPLKDVDTWRRISSQSGYVPIILGSDIHTTLTGISIRPSGEDKLNYIREAAWVVGVENEYTLLAAAEGKRTTMVSGLGFPLYKKMFPRIEVI
jgi:hypothetical protein